MSKAIIRKIDVTDNPVTAISAKARKLLHQEDGIMGLAPGLELFHKPAEPRRRPWYLSTCPAIP